MPMNIMPSLDMPAFPDLSQTSKPAPTIGNNNNMAYPSFNDLSYPSATQGATEIPAYKPDVYQVPKPIDYSMPPPALPKQPDF